jgi:hypothetical protein
MNAGKVAILAKKYATRYNRNEVGWVHHQTRTFDQVVIPQFFIFKEKEDCTYTMKERRGAL